MKVRGHDLQKLQLRKYPISSKSTEDIYSIQPVTSVTNLQLFLFLNAVSLGCTVYNILLQDNSFLQCRISQGKPTAVRMSIE